ncbi:DUF202 domain-containing protein [Rhodococcus sp. ACPA1]|uniref:DUF202 domain-containing protein n=1 Tax=Rhodococcus sp. ACPA1 TaxID=2028572 RepID=UPI000BB15963|nr:DUF202 domain-containing protein [Rhodococcus sp. ACPA1]PBC47451.1 hypothetical protein CJ177_41505 [Rhodococcus sp. ACPA1]
MGQLSTRTGTKKTVPVLFDLGLQPERTALAWRRTVLALVAGSLISAKLLAPLLGWISMLIPLAFLAASVVALTLLHRRYRSTVRALTQTEMIARLPDGRLPALAALMTLALGAIAGGAVVGVFLGP